MAKNEARARPLSGPSGVAGKAAADGEKKREKRTITEIRESKRTGEKMVYMSVPDYTSANEYFRSGMHALQSYNTIDRALVNATRFMQEALSDAVKPQGGKSQAQIL